MPSSQVMVRSRLVDSSGTVSGTRTSGLAGEHRAVERGVARLALVVELLAQPLGHFLGDLSGVDLRAESPLQREDDAELAEIGLDRRLHVRDTAACTASAPAVDGRPPCAPGRARPPPPASGRRSGSASPSPARARPSSAARRRPAPSAAPPPAASAARWRIPAAAGRGRSRASCATFISGPLRPPSAAARSAAFLASPRSRPNSRAPAIRAATPPTLAPTRA